MTTGLFWRPEDKRKRTASRRNLVEGICFPLRELSEATRYYDAWAAEVKVIKRESGLIKTLIRKSSVAESPNNSGYCLGIYLRIAN